MTRLALDDPILGLDETYEPFDLGDDEEVWAAAKGTARGASRSDWASCYPTERDQQAAVPGSTPKATTLGQRLAYARERGFLGVRLLDADLNILKEWPL